MGIQLFSRIEEWLPQGCKVIALLPPVHGLIGVVYIVPYSDEVGAALWDGSALHDLGLFATDRDARDAMAAAAQQHGMRLGSGGSTPSNDQVARMGSGSGADEVLSGRSASAAPPAAGAEAAAAGSLPGGSSGGRAAGAAAAGGAAAVGGGGGNRTAVVSAAGALRPLASAAGARSGSGGRPAVGLPPQAAGPGPGGAAGGSAGAGGGSGGAGGSGALAGAAGGAAEQPQLIAVPLGLPRTRPLTLSPRTATGLRGQPPGNPAAGYGYGGGGALQGTPSHTGLPLIRLAVPNPAPRAQPDRSQPPPDPQDSFGDVLLLMPLPRPAAAGGCTGSPAGGGGAVPLPSRAPLGLTALGEELAPPPARGGHGSPPSVVLAEARGAPRGVAVGGLIRGRGAGAGAGRAAVLPAHVVEGDPSTGSGGSNAGGSGDSNSERSATAASGNRGVSGSGNGSSGAVASN